MKPDESWLSGKVHRTHQEVGQFQQVQLRPNGSTTLGPVGGVFACSGDLMLARERHSEARSWSGPSTWQTAMSSVVSTMLGAHPMTRPVSVMCRHGRADSSRTASY